MRNPWGKDGGDLLEGASKRSPASAPKAGVLFALRAADDLCVRHIRQRPVRRRRGAPASAAHQPPPAAASGATTAQSLRMRVQRLRGSGEEERRRIEELRKKNEALVKAIQGKRKAMRVHFRDGAAASERTKRMNLRREVQLLKRRVCRHRPPVGGAIF